MRWTKRRLAKALQRRRESVRPAVVRESESDKSIAKSTKTVARLTWALAVTAALSAGATSLQWWEIHSGSEDTHTLAVASGKQATAAERQLAVMNASQRAWVGPTNAYISGGVELGSPVKMNVSIVNTGREPAKSFRTFVETITLPWPGALDPIPFISQCFSNGTSPLGHVLYPTIVQSVGTFDIPATFAADQIDQGVMEGKTMLLIRGCITYETVGQTKHSVFCYWFLRGVTMYSGLSICRVGSDAD